MRVSDWKTGENFELKRQLAELEKQFLALKAKFEAYVKAHP